MCSFPLPVNPPDVPDVPLTAWPARHWAGVSARDFALAQRSGLAAQTVAVLPVGAVEQHGPHLPLSVDSTLVDGMVAAALPHLPAEVPVLVLPTQQIGLSLEHASYAGTLGLSPATLLALWTEIGACVARAGVHKLLIFNAHGGNVSSMDIVARQLRMQCGLLVYHSSWFNLPLHGADAAFSAHEHRFGVHGGEMETSMLLHLAPALVRMLGELVGQPTFPEEELERERQVLLHEFAEVEDDPMDTAYRVCDRASFGRHPAAQPVIGTRGLL